MNTILGGLLTQYLWYASVDFLQIFVTRASQAQRKLFTFRGQKVKVIEWRCTELDSVHRVLSRAVELTR